MHSVIKDDVFKYLLYVCVKKIFFSKYMKHYL